jgi:predicted nucleic acid-binding protein
VPFDDAHAALFAEVDDGRIIAVTSELSVAECLVKPFGDRDTERVNRYLEFLDNRPQFSVIGIDRDILTEAARIRAELGLKLPNAIHVATASMSACNVFLTNDQRLRTPVALERSLWDELELG